MSDVYRFGRFMLDPKKRTLSCDGSFVDLTPKVFDILFYLVRNPNRVIGKQELLKAVWPDTFVEEGNLTQNISLLRKALGEQDSRLIVTLARQGYQFTGDVNVTGGPEAVRLSTASADGDRPRVAAVTTMSPNIIAAVVATALLVTATGYGIWRGSRSNATGEGAKVRLAVLPFRNLTGDPRQDYLAEGLTEELITQLARLQPERLRVVARTSVMGYKDNVARLDQIARDLSVQYALENSFRRTADRLRITVRLVRTDDQSQLWTGEFDYAPRDTLTLQEEVAVATSREIHLRLSPEALIPPRRMNPLAFDAYLRGRYFFRLAGRENTDSALHYYNQAISHDSAYALAWVWLSEARRRAGDRGWAPAVESKQQSRLAVERALSLDPKLADAHSQLGWLKMLVDWDWAGSDASFKEALALDPGNADVASGASVIAAKLGRYDEAVELARRSVELDPMNPEMIGTLGQLFYDMGRMDDAAASLKRSLELFSLPHAPALLGLVYLAQGLGDSALAAMDRESSPIWQLHGRALVYHALGRKKEADSTLTLFIARFGEPGSYLVAGIYAFRGEAGRAFEWLDRAYASHNQAVSSARRDRLLTNLRGDPRYATYLRKVRLPP